MCKFVHILSKNRYLYGNNRRMKGISGSELKLMACGAMLVDHVGAFCLAGQEWAMDPLFWKISWYVIARMIGRLAFPIFAFLLVEGFRHTHSKRRYALNLLVFAVITELPWNLLRNGTLFFPEKQNVLWTLLAGFMAMWVYDMLKSRKWAQMFSLAGIYAVSFLCRSDYCAAGVPFIMLVYALQGRLAIQGMTAAVLLPMRPMAALAYIPISLYNGQRGFVKGPWLKYAFYAFYPLHFLLIYLIRCMFVL